MSKTEKNHAKALPLAGYILSVLAILACGYKMSGQLFALETIIALALVSFHNFTVFYLNHLYAQGKMEYMSVVVSKLFKTMFLFAAFAAVIILKVVENTSLLASAFMVGFAITMAFEVAHLQLNKIKNNKAN